jgi:signal transduction histidine kinase
MKKRLRVIFIAFCISFAFMAALSLYAIKQFSSLIEYSQQVDHANNVISQIYGIENMLKEVEVKERGFIITRDSSFLNELFVINSQILPATDSLKDYFTKDQGQLNTLRLLRATLIDRRDNIKDNLLYIDTTRQNGIPPAFYKGREYDGQANQYFESMRRKENETLQQRYKTKMYYQRITYSTIRYLLTTFAITTIFLFIILIRELKRRMTFQDELQMKVADLKRSHAELEQIAYAVSHDLQEPLRKIQIFSNRLLYVKKNSLDEENRSTLERINSSAARMHDLIDDLMNLTSLVKEEQMNEVNLNQALQTVLHELQEKIREKNASIHTEVLPTITGHAKQIQLLLKSLIDNSLKFSKDDETPVISIRCDRINSHELKEKNIPVSEQQQFYRVTIADNGIGFEDKFINKMFQIFQSLHNKSSEYSGKGIGLAICQRVIANHGGYILPHGRPGIGATFRLYFPVNE